MKRRKQDEVQDDGRTIADMNIEGTPWYRETTGDRREREDYSDLNKKKLIKEAYKKFLMATLIWVGLMVVVMLGISYLWLS